MGRRSLATHLLKVSLGIDNEEAAEGDALVLDKHAVVRGYGLGLVGQDYKVEGGPA